ncbi:MAG: RsiV family protein [Thermotogota bacterium]|nr:RsiV family protein [Thermotogota bacterium]
MNKKIITVLFLMGMFITVALVASDQVEITERTMKIQLPTFSLLNENEALDKINETLYLESFSLLKTTSVDVETDFSRWDVIDYYSQATKTFENNHLISFKMDQYLYTYRSAHGSHLYIGFVFDLETGKELSLNEIFTVNDTFLSVVKGIMQEVIKEKDIPIFDFTEFKGLDDSAESYLQNEVLVIVFQEYAYTPYVYGPLIFQIPLSEITDFFNNKYF